MTPTGPIQLTIPRLPSGASGTMTQRLVDRDRLHVTFTGHADGSMTNSDAHIESEAAAHQLGTRRPLSIVTITLADEQAGA